MPTRLAKTLLCALFAALPAAPASAKDYVLTIGGGYSPTGNQVSLEKNVLFFQRLLAEQLGDVRHDIFFSDGHSPGRDINFDASAEVPRVNRLLAQVFDKEEFLGLNYRSNEIPGVTGESSEENIERWFDEVGSRLQSGDRLILYVTAHGGSSKDKEHPKNTCIYLWNRKNLTEVQLTKYLDRLPAGVSVVAIMVQCHAGGFANMVFRDGDPAGDVVENDRCGFFATVHDRSAAGCTPDIAEENYQEYSTFFWAAIGGKTRIDKPIDLPDYDGNGEVSFAEAHAYTLLASNTIDIPIKTSGEMLRKLVKIEGDPPAGWVTTDAPFDDLLALAAPPERAVLEGLSVQLKLSGSDRVAEAHELAKSVQKDRDRLSKISRRKGRELRSCRNEIAQELKLAWPELSNPYHGRITEILVDHGNEIVKLIESHKRYSQFARLHDELDSIVEQRLDLERRWAKCQRLIRTAENVALAANLDKIEPTEMQERYRRMVAAENSTLRHVSSK